MVLYTNKTRVASRKKRQVLNSRVEPVGLCLTPVNFSLNLVLKYRHNINDTYIDKRSYLYILNTIMSILRHLFRRYRNNNSIIVKAFR